MDFWESVVKRWSVVCVTWYFPIIFGCGTSTFWVQLLPCNLDIFGRGIWILKIVFMTHNFLTECVCRV